MMLRTFTAIIVVLAFQMPAFALTTKQKMETCNFGATDQKLSGQARKTFIAKCMAPERAPTKPAEAKPKQ